MGRPSKYTEEIAESICAELMAGESLKSICEREDMPDKATVFRWIANNQDFRDKYAHAREVQAEGLADELLEIADDGRNDWIEVRNKDGEVLGYRENGEAIRRSALRVDTRKWVASKLLPKKYGDKLQAEVSGKDGGPVVFTVSKIGEKA